MTKITINDNAEHLFGRFDFPTFDEFIEKVEVQQDMSDSDLFPSSVVYNEYSPFPKIVSIKCEFARAADVEYPCKHENEYAAFITVELCNVEKSYGDGTHSFMTYAYTDFAFYAGMPRVDVIRGLYDEMRDKVLADMSLLPADDEYIDTDADYTHEMTDVTSPVGDDTPSDTGIEKTVIIDFSDDNAGNAVTAESKPDAEIPAAHAMPGTATNSISTSVTEASSPTDLVLYTNDYGVSTMICKCDYDVIMAAKSHIDDAKNQQADDAGKSNDVPAIDKTHYAVDKTAYLPSSRDVPLNLGEGGTCPACGRVDDPHKARVGVLGWDDAFMATARLFAMRSKDPNTQVGACIVDKHHRILSIGYNGTPNGMNDGEFPWGRDGDDELDKKYLFVCHSELNAVLNFRGSTERMQGATLYVDLFPCNECAKVIAQSGISEVVYLRDLYPDTDSVIASKRIFDSCGIAYRHYESGYDKIEIPMK